MRKTFSRRIIDRNPDPMYMTVSVEEYLKDERFLSMLAFHHEFKDAAAYIKNKYGYELTQVHAEYAVASFHPTGTRPLHEYVDELGDYWEVRGACIIRRWIEYKYTETYRHQRNIH